jgi:small subunit ribosomal protein S5
VVSSARRPFHSSPIHQKRKPRFPSVKATPTSTQVDLERAARDFAASSAGQQDGAATKQYTPEQQAAIEAARKLIDPEQLAKQTGMRTDPWQVKYYDDLTKIDPVVDKPVRAPWTNIDDASRLKSPEEFEQDLLKLMHDIPTPKNDNDYDPAIWDKFDRSLRLTVGREEAERRPRTALAPDLPKISPPAEKRKTTRGRDGEMVAEEEPSPSLVRLMQMTGYNRKQLAGLRVKTIVQHGVANQTRLGKVRKSWFLTVAGNGQGLIGVGEGKGVEMEEARLQSQYRAIRDMKPILRYEDRTIFGDVDAKVSATELELYARPPGMYQVFVM